MEVLRLMDQQSLGVREQKGRFQDQIQTGGPMDFSGGCPNQMDLLYLSRKKFREQLRLAEINRGLRNGPGPVLIKPCSHPGI